MHYMFCLLLLVTKILSTRRDFRAAKSKTNRQRTMKLQLLTICSSTAQNGDTHDDSLLWRNSSASTAIYDRPHQSDGINIQQFATRDYKDDFCLCESVTERRWDRGLANDTANNGWENKVTYWTVAVLHDKHLNCFV